MKHAILVLVLTAGWSSMAFSQAAPAPPPQDPPPVLAVPKEYKYDSRGRRDPFINPVPKPVTAGGTVVPSIRPPGLKGVLIAEASVAGVVTSREPTMNVVIINAPGGKTYFARIGEELFDAVVKEIRLDTVTFALRSSPTDTETPREIVRRVRPTPGE